MARDEKEIAAFAGFIGYYTFLVASSCMINSGFMNFGALKISTILGVETLDMGAVAGIVSGIITASLHNRYHKITFPVAISFYGGKRFVAIVVIMAMAVVGLVAPIIWSPVSMVIDGMGGLISATGLAGVFGYGFLERLLIPTGLHHVLNGIFRTTSIGGTYEGVEGCLNIFLQFVDKVDISELRQFTVFFRTGENAHDDVRTSGSGFGDLQDLSSGEKKQGKSSHDCRCCSQHCVRNHRTPGILIYVYCSPPVSLPRSHGRTVLSAHGGL